MSTPVRFELQPGALAPLFTLHDVRGGEVSLSSQLKQQRAVLVFYRGGWCPLCNRQLGELSALHEEFRARGAQIYAISNDRVKKGAAALERIGPPYPVLFDEESLVIRSYGLVIESRDPLGWALGKRDYAHPAVLLVERDGTISWVYRGRNYRDRPSARAILDALDAGTEPQVGARQSFEP